MNSADIIFNATVDGAGVDLDLTSGATGDIFFNAAVGQTDPIGTVTINEARDVNIAAAFTSATFNQAVAGVGTFNLDALLTANTGGVTINSNAVDLDGSIRTTAAAQDITIDGQGGLIDLATGESITTTPTADGAAAGNVAITANNAGSINLDGDVVSSGAASALVNGGDGGTIDLVATGAATITIDGNLTSSGGLTSNDGSDGGAAGAITVNSAGTTITLEATTITAAGGAGAGAGEQGNGATISFNDLVALTAGASELTTGATTGNIDFLATLDGEQALTLTAGEGDIRFVGVVGNTDPLGLVTINAADNVTVTTNFSASAFNQAVAGTGVFTQSAGTLTANTGGVTINSDLVDLDGSIATTGVAQPVSITGSNAVDIPFNAIDFKLAAQSPPLRPPEPTLV